MSDKKIDIALLLQSMESLDPQIIEDLRNKLESDSELKKALTIEVGRYFLSCIAVSEVFDLKLDEFMNSHSPEELAGMFSGQHACSSDQCGDCGDNEKSENGCCGSC